MAIKPAIPATITAQPSMVLWMDWRPGMGRNLPAKTSNPAAMATAVETGAFIKFQETF